MLYFLRDSFGGFRDSSDDGNNLRAFDARESIQVLLCERACPTITSFMSLVLPAVFVSPQM
jgi:hypothetical protein